MRRNIEAKRNLYENLLNRMHETELTKSLQTNNVRIIQKALVPVSPVPKRIPLKLALAFMVIFSLGLGVVFMVEMLDNRFKNLDDVRVVPQ